jgi:hypothetical protein
MLTLISRLIPRWMRVHSPTLVAVVRMAAFFRMLYPAVLAVLVERPRSSAETEPVYAI